MKTLKKGVGRTVGRFVFFFSAITLTIFFAGGGIAGAEETAKTDKKPLTEQVARSAPESVTRGVIYQINARAFTPEGTLAAAAKKLPTLAELGVTIVYLCPVFVSDDDPRQEFWSPRQKKSGMNNPRNPYRMKDYYHVDPEYGTDADLKAFIAEAHRLGMKAILDMVYLHCGPAAVFIESHPEYFLHDKDGKIVNAAWAFPGLDFKNGGLREYLWKNMEYWVNDFGADGFRLDVADGIPLDFWLEARKRLDAIRPGLILFAEGVRKEDQLAVMDLNYGFPFFSALDSVLSRGKPASEVRKTKETMANCRPVGARFAHYFDNHDIANDDYDNRREAKWGDAGVRAAFVLCFTLDGTPMIYNGQEIADTNRHSIFGRLPIDWKKAETDAGRQRSAFIQNLIKVRLENGPLTDGNLHWLDNDRPDGVLSFLRTAGEKRILVVINLKNEAAKGAVAVEAANGSPILENGTIKAENGKVAFDLPPFGYNVSDL